MKRKLIRALIPVSIVFLCSLFTFLTEGIGEPFVPWKFWASLFSMIGFGFFVIALIRELVK